MCESHTSYDHKRELCINQQITTNRWRATLTSCEILWVNRLHSVKPKTYLWLITISYVKSAWLSQIRDSLVEIWCGVERNRWLSDRHESFFHFRDEMKNDLSQRPDRTDTRVINQMLLVVGGSEPGGVKSLFSDSWTFRHLYLWGERVVFICFVFI